MCCKDLVFLCPFLPWYYCCCTHLFVSWDLRAEGLVRLLPVREQLAHCGQDCCTLSQPSPARERTGARQVLGGETQLDPFLGVRGSWGTCSAEGQPGQGRPGWLSRQWLSSARTVLSSVRRHLFVPADSTHTVSHGKLNRLESNCIYIECVQIFFLVISSWVIHTL